MKKIKPDIYKDNVFNINYKYLKKIGIKLIVFDLDNTLAYIKENDASNRVKELFNNLLKDFKVIVASNNCRKRVYRYVKWLNCEGYYHVFKPFLFFTKTIDKYQFKKNEVLIIGDQFFTDILFGVRAGYKTLLVDPLGEKDLRVTWFNRRIERIMKKRINFKDGEYYEESQTL